MKPFGPGGTMVARLTLVKSLADFKSIPILFETSLCSMLLTSVFYRFIVCFLSFHHWGVGCPQENLHLGFHGARYSTDLNDSI